MIDTEATFSASALTSDRQRILWIDIARGIGILLVVFGHSWRGLHSAGILHDDHLFVAVDRAIYLFHMPLFFFISGYLYYGMKNKKNMLKNIRRNVYTLIYPLFVWSYFQYGIKYAAGDIVNNPVNLNDFIYAPFPPKDMFWFLWALFLIYTITHLLAKISNNNGLLLLAVSAFTIFAPKSLYAAYIPGTFGPAIQNLPYFALGVLLAGVGRLNVQPRMAIFAVAAFAGTELLFAHFPVTAARTAAATVCILAVAVLSQVIAQYRRVDAVAAWLAILGVHSMSIYLAHVIFSSSLRIGLHLSGIQSVMLHLLLGTMAGVVGPLILYRFAVRYKTNRLLGLR